MPGTRCTTHYHGCECREAELDRLRDVAEAAYEITDDLESCGSCTVCWRALADCLPTHCYAGRLRAALDRLDEGDAGD